jgi:hypothetical protein
MQDMGKGHMKDKNEICKKLGLGGYKNGNSLGDSNIEWDVKKMVIKHWMNIVTKLDIVYLLCI